MKKLISVMGAVLPVLCIANIFLMIYTIYLIAEINSLYWIGIICEGSFHVACIFWQMDWCRNEKKIARKERRESYVKHNPMEDPLYREAWFELEKEFPGYKE